MSKHVKRLVAPKSWGIQRKISTWVTKPSSGPHAVGRSVPLLVLLRDMMKMCDSAREAKHIIGNRNILVDGRTVTDHKFPVGFMDVVSVPKTGDHYRMMMDTHGRFRLTSITGDEAKTKLLRIENKKTLPGGKLQLNLHDGRNMLIEKNIYKTGDVLKVDIEQNKILKHIPLKEGNLALLVGGSHPGELVTVQSFKIKRGSSQNLISFKEGFATVWDHVFVVGTKSPEIKLLEVGAI